MLIEIAVLNFVFSFQSSWRVQCSASQCKSTQKHFWCCFLTMFVLVWLKLHLWVLMLTEIAILNFVFSFQSSWRVQCSASQCKSTDPSGVNRLWFNAHVHVPTKVQISAPPTPASRASATNCSCCNACCEHFQHGVLAQRGWDARCMVPCHTLRHGQLISSSSTSSSSSSTAHGGATTAIAT